MEKAVILKTVYKKLLNEEFNYFNFEDRLKLQKTVYLLENMGVSVGGYGFNWYKHGPYSQALQDDAYDSVNYHSREDIQFKENAKPIIENFREMVAEKPEDCELEEWLELLSSIYFLANMSEYNSKEIILEKIKEEKPHLKNERINEKAYEVLQEKTDLF
ncbi:MAG: hypothetical protein ACOCQA_03345 [bacterium]